MQSVELNAGFVVNPSDRRLHGRDDLHAVLGDGKSRSHGDNTHGDASLSFGGVLFGGAR